MSTSPRRSPLASHNIRLNHVGTTPMPSTSTDAAGSIAGTRAERMRVRGLQQYDGELERMRVRKRGNRPLSERTKKDYRYIANRLHEWMTDAGHDVGWDGLTPAILNAFFDADHQRNRFDGEGREKPTGTHVKFRNLRNFVNWVAREYEIPNPYDTLGTGKEGDLRYYAENPPPDKVLAPEVVSELLEHAAVQAARSERSTRKDKWVARRDHALFHMLTYGARGIDVLAMTAEDVTASGSRNVILMRDSKSGGNIRRLYIEDDAADALDRWLKVRGRLPFIEDPFAGPLWISSRGTHAPIGKAGLRQLIDRRAAEVGWDRGQIEPHMFRHTRRHELEVKGASGATIDNQLGWTSGAMRRRYGSSMADHRALNEMAKLGGR